MLDRHRLRKVEALERARDVNGLRGLLHDGSSPSVVDRVAGALRAVGGRDAIDALVAGLGAVSSGTRGPILARLGEIGPPAVDALVDTLLTGRFGGDGELLLGALNTIMPSARASAAGVGRLSRAAAKDVRELVWAGDFVAALSLLTQISADAVSLTAVSATTWGDADLTGSAADLVAAEVWRELTMAEHFLRPDAVDYGAMFNDCALADALARLDGLLDTLPDGISPAVSPPSGDGEPGDGRIVLAMIRLLRGGDAGRRRVAAERLGDLGGTEAVAALRGSLDDSDAGVRWAVFGALRDLGGLDSVALLRVPLRDERWPIRLAAVAALRRIGGPETLPALRDRLEDSHHEVRKAALAVAARMDDGVLVRGVEDPHEEVRLRAALVAAHLGDPRRADVLVPLLVDACGPVRDCAAETLRRWGWNGGRIA